MEVLLEIVMWLEFIVTKLAWQSYVNYLKCAKYVLKTKENNEWAIKRAKEKYNESLK